MEAKIEYKNKFEYIRSLFASETTELQNIKKNTTDKNDQIYISQEAGRILQFLIELGGIKNIIELGTLSGYSSSFMAESLPDDGHIYSFERDKQRANNALKNINSSKITIIIGKALEQLKTIEGKDPFDMIFIDADKLNYSNYLDWGERNIRKGGLIVADNTLLFDTVWSATTKHKRVSTSAHKAMKEFNKRLANRDKYTSIMLPIDDGLTISIKKF